LRFAVRRPATRPVIPRGHRAAAGDVAALPSGRPAARDDRAGVSTVVRSWTRVGGSTPPRRSLALLLAAPDPYGDRDARAWRRDALPGWAGFGRAALAAPDPYGDRDAPVSRRDALPGPMNLGRDGTYAMGVPGTLTPPDDLAALTARTDHVPVEAASPYAPEVLAPTRVLPARRAQTARLGETTGRLLLRHLREGRARPKTTETPGREWRSLPGAQARALTPRGR
jgi:hypothetical protein